MATSTWGAGLLRLIFGWLCKSDKPLFIRVVLREIPWKSLSKAVETDPEKRRSLAWTGGQLKRLESMIHSGGIKPDPKPGATPLKALLVCDLNGFSFSEACR